MIDTRLNVLAFIDPATLEHENSRRPPRHRDLYRNRPGVITRATSHPQPDKAVLWVVASPSVLAGAVPARCSRPFHLKTNRLAAREFSFGSLKCQGVDTTTVLCAAVGHRDEPVRAPDLGTDLAVSRSGPKSTPLPIIQDLNPELVELCKAKWAGQSDLQAHHLRLVGPAVERHERHIEVWCEPVMSVCFADLSRFPRLRGLHVGVSRTKAGHDECYAGDAE
jgi:hypothetical protein